MSNIEAYFDHVCLYGDIERLKYIALMNPDINATYSHALENACERGHLDICKWIYSEFFDEDDDVRGEDCEYIITACTNGHLEVVQWLNTVFMYGGDYEYAFDAAIENNHIHICKWLYDLEPDFTTRSIDFSHICQYSNLEMLQWIHEIKGDIELTIYIYAFINACKNGNLSLAKWLLSIEPLIDIGKWIYDLEPIAICYTDVNYLDKQKFDLILDVIKNDNIEVLKWLYDLCPILFHNGDKLLFQSCKYGYLELSKWLMEIDLDLHPYDLTFNILDDCQYTDSLEMLQWIYKENSNSLTIDNFNLIFSFACKYGHLNICQWLYSLKLELNIVNNNFITDDLFSTSCFFRRSELGKWLYKICPNIKYDVKKIFGNIYNTGYDLDFCKWLYEIFMVEDEIVIDHDTFERAIVHQDIELGKWLATLDNSYTFVRTGIKTFIYQKTYNKRKVETIEQCTICKDQLSTMVTECSHQFCKSCLLLWLEDHNSCPYCRQSINRKRLYDIES
jgi:hypothetical protein